MSVYRRVLVSRILAVTSWSPCSLCHFYANANIPLSVAMDLIDTSLWWSTAWRTSREWIDFHIRTHQLKLPCWLMDKHFNPPFVNSTIETCWIYSFPQTQSISRAYKKSSQSFNFQNKIVTTFPSLTIFPNKKCCHVIFHQRYDKGEVVFFDQRVPSPSLWVQLHPSFSALVPWLLVV